MHKDIHNSKCKAIDFKAEHSQEEHFKSMYKQAYDRIEPDANYMVGIAEKVEQNKQQRLRTVVSVMRPVAAVCCIALILSMTALPAMAKSIPIIYNVLAKYAPALADYVLPVETSDTSLGITMQVEAIHVKDNTAQIVVSFSDAEGSSQNLIKGKVDMYDSYHLRSYGTDNEIGGCHFLEYDEAEDKAYFKIDVTTSGEFDKSKLNFRVYQILTNCSEEKRSISLDNLVMTPATKQVTLNGLGGSQDRSVIEQYLRASADGSPRPSGQVLDLQKADAGMAEALTITGIGYADGILRIQTCRGNLTNADRHMQPFLLDVDEKERYNDFSLSWQEEVDGKKLSFDEHWFLIEEKELENIQVYGIFWITDGSMKGDWEVTTHIFQF